MESVVSAFKKKYPSLSRSRVVDKIARLFEESNGEPMCWDNLTKPNLHALVERVKEEVSPNSAKYYMAALKSVLSMYDDEVDLPKDYKKILSLKKIATISTWLTESDIDKIVKYAPKSETEELVKNQFIVGCLTGARHSDYERFTRTNIVNDKLVYVSQKTKIRAEIPLSPAVLRLLQYYDIAKKIDEQVFNETIREICQNCGICEIVHIYHGGKDITGEKWRFVSSHTARRSFATNVYLRCRDIFLVSRYMGHASVDMTANYILSIGDAPKEVREYFEKFR